MYKIYGKENCRYCDAAAKLLEQKSQPFVQLKVERDFTREMLFEMVPHAKSYPQIFYKDEYIGGYEQLVERFQNYDPARFLSE
jgi:glutaredoxin